MFDQKRLFILKFDIYVLNNTSFKCPSCAYLCAYRSEFYEPNFWSRYAITSHQSHEWSIRYSFSSRELPHKKNPTVLNRISLEAKHSVEVDVDL